MTIPKLTPSIDFESLSWSIKYTYQSRLYHSKHQTLATHCACLCQWSGNGQNTNSLTNVNEPYIKYILEYHGNPLCVPCYEPNENTHSGWGKTLRKRIRKRMEKRKGTRNTNDSSLFSAQRGIYFHISRNVVKGHPTASKCFRTLQAIPPTNQR